MEPEDNPPMSGSNSICVATVLLEKGIIDSPDGGYLTDLGLDLIEHVTVLHSALSS